MNENMMERLQAQTDEEQAGDREREHTRREEAFENASIMEKMHMIEEDVKELNDMVAGLSEPTFRYENDEGEDVRELAAKAEQRAEALWDRKLEQWAEKHQMDKDL